MTNIDLKEWNPSEDSESTFGKFLMWINGIIRSIKEHINGYMNNEIESCKVVFGTYTGNYVSSDTTTAKQFINLGFTPVAVEVYGADGFQASSSAYSMYRWYYSGGFAIRDNPCKIIELDTEDVILEIVENGFNVYSGYKTQRGVSYACGLNTGEHYFKAYKTGEIR